MLEEASSRAQLRVLVSALCQLLTPDRLPHRVIRFAIQALEATASVRIEQVRERVGLSHRRLSELFKQQVGVTPKRFQRLVRLRRFIVDSATTRDLADLALLAGYYDQPHLSHEVRERRRAPRSCSTSRTKTTAGAAIPAATRRGTPGLSAATIRSTGDGRPGERRRPGVRAREHRVR